MLPKRLMYSTDEDPSNACRSGNCYRPGYGSIRTHNSSETTRRHSSHRRSSELDGQMPAAFVVSERVPSFRFEFSAHHRRSDGAPELAAYEGGGQNNRDDRKCDQTVLH
jgi:hypothetical protein